MCVILISANDAKSSNLLFIFSWESITNDIIFLNLKSCLFSWLIKIFTVLMCRIGLINLLNLLSFYYLWLLILYLESKTYFKSLLYIPLSLFSLIISPKVVYWNQTLQNHPILWFCLYQISISLNSTFYFHFYLQLIR